MATRYQACLKILSKNNASSASFYGAIRIDTFEEPDRFKSRLQSTADRIRHQARQDPGAPVQIPGDPEKAHQADREAYGIPINDTVLKQFETIAMELEIAPLAP